MSKDLLVKYNNEPCYPIYIETSFAAFSDKWKRISDASGRKVCIVSDDEVAKRYMKNLMECCHSCFDVVETFIFENGEASKNIETVKKLYEHLIKSHFERKDLLIALGGGVVGDLTGFTAATYLRGIDFIQVPTTLLSQVDSSIGGKTGVDFLQYKNMVGAFYMPKMVYINTSVLQTLPKEQFQSGMGEVIKHGLIKNREYYDWLKENRDAICDLQKDVMEELIYESCKIKQQVVEEDPKEKGIRAHLNFGHTIGHAVEKLSGFSLYHGQCVAVGMHAAAFISYRQGKLSLEDYEDILSVIRQFGLPLTVSDNRKEDILAATKSDKKMDGNKIKFVVLHKLGEAAIDTSLTDEMLMEAISEIMEG